MTSTTLTMPANHEVSPQPISRKPMVAQVLHSLSVGGAELLAAGIAQRLQDEFQFVFMCLDDAGPLRTTLVEQGYAVCVVNRRPGFDARSAWRLRRLLREHCVDVVHAHQYTPFFYSALSRLGHDLPLLFTEHGRWYPDARKLRRVVANRCLLGRHDRVVAVGKNVQRALVDNEGIPVKRVNVVYNGIDIARYRRTDASARIRYREDLQLDAKDFVIIQVARLDALKDHATAIRAFARVAADIPNARLLLVGDGPERHEIERQILAAGMKDSIRQLGTRRDVAELLAASDTFLLTSVSEGIPLTLIEAMAAGLPVVSTRVGGVPEVVEDGVTGLLADRGSDEQLAACLVQLASATATRISMGVAGRQRAEQVFSSQRMDEAYRLIYRELCCDRR